jgi:hypothetical protein
MGHIAIQRKSEEAEGMSKPYKILCDASSFRAALAHVMDAGGQLRHAAA